MGFLNPNINRLTQWAASRAIDDWTKINKNFVWFSSCSIFILSKFKVCLLHKKLKILKWWRLLGLTHFHFLKLSLPLFGSSTSSQLAKSGTWHNITYFTSHYIVKLLTETTASLLYCELYNLKIDSDPDCDDNIVKQAIHIHGRTINSQFPCALPSGLIITRSSPRLLLHPSLPLLQQLP